MDDHLRSHRDASLEQLDALIRRGRQIRDGARIADCELRDATRAWQRECAAIVNQLSGLSKAHWLARAYSGAFLVRSADGGVVVEAEATEIIDRVLDVLGQAATSLSRMDDVVADPSGAAPRPRRFEFVHNVELRPLLERAFDDGRAALERGDHRLALILSCGVIEAIITDALQHGGLRIADCGLGTRRVADWSFEARITAAEREGLIRGGCARLPRVARAYRDLTDADGQLGSDVSVSERDARVTAQVLHVVMRDLDPGR